MYPASWYRECSEAKDIEAAKPRNSQIYYAKPVLVPVSVRQIQGTMSRVCATVGDSSLRAVDVIIRDVKKSGDSLLLELMIALANYDCDSCHFGYWMPKVFLYLHHSCFFVLMERFLILV